MFAAFGLFTAGAVVSISHGISELRNPEPAIEEREAVDEAVLTLSTAEEPPLGPT